MSQSRSQDIFLTLEKAGLDPYYPTQKKGECTSPYVVVRNSASSQFLNTSSTINYYDLMCYVPQSSYSQLEVFLERVKRAMSELSPGIQPTFTQTPSFYDESVKAHMVSIQYKNYRKI